MNCIVIDDESLSLQFMTRALGAYAQITSLHAFENAAQALRIAEFAAVFVVFGEVVQAVIHRHTNHAAAKHQGDDMHFTKAQQGGNESCKNTGTQRQERCKEGACTAKHDHHQQNNTE